MSELVKCPYCAELIQAEAKKCRHCGEWLDPAARVVASTGTAEPRWETCEITFDTQWQMLSRKYTFYAMAIGPNGQYVAAQGPAWTVVGGSAFVDYSHFKKRKAGESHDNVVQQLMADGWEPTTDRGEAWFNHRFRRRVKSAPAPA